MDISVQKSFLIEFCHWRRGWLYEVDVEDAISLEVNPVDRPEGEDFDSSAASCWPGNVRVMTAVFEPSSDFIEVDHADPHSEPPAPPDSRNWGICLGPVVSDGATTNTMPIPEPAPIPIPFYVIMAAQRGAFLEQHFTPSVALASSAGHLIMFHTSGCWAPWDFPFRISESVAIRTDGGPSCLGPSSPLDTWMHNSGRTRRCYLPPFPRPHKGRLNNSRAEIK